MCTTEWHGVICRYPLMNFAICTALYVLLSHRLFMLTNDLKNVAIPGKDANLLWRNAGIMLVTGAGLYAAGAVLLRLSTLAASGSFT